MRSAMGGSKCRGRRLRNLGVVGILGFVLANIVIPSAQAATWTYANKYRTTMGQAVSSGPRSVVSGGTAQLHLAFGDITIVTYYNYPGYKELWFATSDASSTANMNHAPTSNSESKCYWLWESVGGTAEVTCAVKY